MEKQKTSDFEVTNENINTFEHDIAEIAKELSLTYQNKELDLSKFWEEELDLVRNGLYVQGINLLLTAYDLHREGKLLGTSCTSGGHVVDFKYKRRAHKKVMKQLNFLAGMTIEDLFAELHVEMPDSFSSILGKSA